MDTQPVAVLVVDDDRGIRELIEQMLASQSGRRFGSEAVGSLTDALGKLRTARFDVVLLDLDLPDSMGLDTLRVVIAEAGAPPVVVLTGSDEALAEEAIRSGAQDYLTKAELTRRHLATSLRYAVERGRSRERLREAVRERTAQLEQANRHLAQEVDRRTDLEHALMLEQGRLVTILDLLPALVWVADEDGTVNFCNRFFRDRLGEPHGRPCHELLHGTEARCAGCPDIPGERACWLAETREEHLTDGRWYQLQQYPLPAGIGQGGALFLGVDVTEQRRAEDQLRASHARFRALFETTRDALMVLDSEGFLDCNEATLRTFGCAIRDEFLGKHPSELSPPLQSDGTDSRTAADGHIATAMATGGARFEWTHRRADGTSFEAEVLLSRCELNGRAVLQASVRDITPLKEARLQLERSEELFRAFVAASQDAIIVLGADGSIRLYNPAAERVFGWSESEMQGQPVDRLMPPEFGAGHADRVAGYFQVGSPNAAIGQTLVLPALTREGTPISIELTLSAGEAAGEPFVLGVLRDVTARLQSEERTRLLATAVGQAAEAIVITDKDGAIEYVNPAFTRVTGYSAEEAAGQNPRILKSGKHDDAFYAGMWRTLAAGEVWQGRLVNKRKDGSEFEEEAVLSPVTGDDGRVTHYVAVKRDVSQQVRQERALRHSQKLEAIGQLAAGVAHEINTPMQFIGDNVRFLEDAWSGVAEVSRAVQAVLGSQGGPEQLAALEAAVGGADLDFLLSEAPTAISQSLEGVQRVNRIVLAMRDFSHPGGDTKSPADLNRAVESTATVSRNVWKYVADLDLDLDPDLPAVPCVLGDFNQVLLNLITNAAHAIGDVAAGRPGGKGKIRVGTRRECDWAEVSVEDDGGGIPTEIRERVFDPFFTTKGVGKGTGQGLALAYATIVEKHRGELSFESEIGVGTRFIVRLPLVGGSEGSEAIDDTSPVR